MRGARTRRCSGRLCYFVALARYARLPVLAAFLCNLGQAEAAGPGLSVCNA